MPVGLILIAAYLPMGLRDIVIRSLRGLGEVLPGTIAEGLSVVAFIAVVWPAMHALGLPGVAVALLVANSLSLLYLVHYLWTRLALGPADWWGLNLATCRDVLRIAHGTFGVAR